MNDKNVDKFQLETLKIFCERLQDANSGLQEEREYWEERSQRLHGLLAIFGAHTITCDINSLDSCFALPLPCNCGLQAMLDEYRQHE